MGDGESDGSGDDPRNSVDEGQQAEDKHDQISIGILLIALFLVESVDHL